MQVHILSKHPIHYKTPTYTHRHITEQVQTTTVQDTKLNSHNRIKNPQYKVTIPTALSRLLENEEIHFSFLFAMDIKI